MSSKTSYDGVCLYSEEGASSSQARRSRTLRVKNLPPGTQEGLLQQALEKHSNVKRVEVFEDRNDAIVELTSVAVSLLSRQFHTVVFPTHCVCRRRVSFC